MTTHPMAYVSCIHFDFFQGHFWEETLYIVHTGNQEFFEQQGNEILLTLLLQNISMYIHTHIYIFKLACSLCSFINLFTKTTAATVRNIRSNWYLVPGNRYSTGTPGFATCLICHPLPNTVPVTWRNYQQCMHYGFVCKCFTQREVERIFIILFMTNRRIILGFVEFIWWELHS